MARKKILDRILEIENQENFEPIGDMIVEIEPEPKIQLSKDVEIMPDKDFRITQNEIDIIITKGVSVTIPRRFLQNMVTEKVIDKIPK